MLQDEIGLQNYIELLWRRRWVMAAVFGIVICLSAIGISMSKTVYSAHSKVAVKNQTFWRTSMLTFSQGTDEPASTMSPETYEKILNGLPFAERVAQHMLREGMPIDPMIVKGSIVAEYQEPDLIIITARNIDPNLAVTLSNSSASVFEEYTKTRARDELSAGRESAVNFQRKALEEAEQLEERISQFRQEMGFLDISTEMKTLRDKTALFEQARGEEVTKLEIARAKFDDMMSLAKIGADGLDLDDPHMEAYRRLQEAATEAKLKYTDDHPVVKNIMSQIREIEDRLRATIARSGANLSPETFLTLREDLATTEAEIQNLETAINSWTRQIEEVKLELKQYPEKQSYLQSLEDAAHAARESYKTWTDRLEEIDFKTSMAPTNASVVDWAIYPTPTMSKTTMLGLAMIFSVMMAIGTGFLREFADTTLRNPEEITDSIGIGYLGSIHRLKEPRQIVFSEGSAVNQIAEAYTRVYSNIRFAEIEKPLKTILITSARKGEGKSTTLVNLGCAMASAGKRIVIVDTDLRNPTLQRILGTKHRHGLTSVLAGEIPLAGAVVPTSHPGLSLLPAGPIPPNPAELLHSEAMKDVIAELQQRADLILFDSPPALLVADAMLLAGELDAAIITAEAGGVSRKAVQQVKESLAVTKTRILGVILNKTSQAPGSYYNYYSYYNYREQEEAPPQTTLARIKGGFGNLRKTIGKSG